MSGPYVLYQDSQPDWGTFLKDLVPPKQHHFSEAFRAPCLCLDIQAENSG